MQKGQKVKWKWGNGYAEGTIKEAFDHKITRTIKGTEVTRDGSSKDRAILIEQEDGDRVLKLESEVQEA
ncbi:DUF2945 domain-containing protein [soil metagenome]